MTYYFYIGILVVGILYCVLNLGAILARPGKDYQDHLMIVLSVIIISLISYIFEITSTTIPGKMISIRMEITANAFANMFFLLYLLRFCNYKVCNKFRVMFAMLHFIGLVCVYTTGQHHLYYTSVSLVRDHGIMSISLGKGPIYYAYVAFQFLHMPIYEIGCFLRFRKSEGRTRKMYGRLMIAGFAPYLMFIIYASGLTGPYDITSMGFLAFAIIISNTIRKCGLVDSVTIAKDKLIGGMAAGVLVTDEAGNFKYANPAAEEIFPELVQYKEDNAQSISVKKLLNLRNNKVYRNQHVYDCDFLPMSEKDISLGNIYILHEITEIEKLVRRDSMTGLYNHAAFFDLLEQCAERCNYDGQKMSIAFLDIDDFKKVNDTYGHSNGDLVLLKLTEIMKHYCYEKAYPCRYGGEEFAIIFEGDNAVYAKEVMECILQELKDYPFPFCDYNITFSCAVCHYQKGVLIEDFFTQTDQLLYTVKRNGKNQILEKVS